MWILMLQHWYVGLHSGASEKSEIYLQDDVDNQTDRLCAVVTLSLYRLIAFNLTFSNVMGNSEFMSCNIIDISRHYLETFDQSQWDISQTI